MNAKHMIQILPVISHISGWGNVMGAQVADIKDRCNKVMSFKVGDVLVRRVEGSGETFATDEWLVDTGMGLTRIDMTWPGHSLTFEQGDY